MRLISIKSKLKKQVIYNNPQHYWSWFKQNIYMVQNYPSREAIEEFMKSFEIHLDYYCKGLSYTASFMSDMILINFTARGNPIFVEAIVALVFNAPELDKIEITSFEEADITAEEIKEGSIIIKTDNLRIQFNELTYYIYEICEESRRFGVMIFCPELVFIKDKAKLVNEIYIHLVRYLGEQFIYQKILDFSFLTTPISEKGEPIAYLKEDLEGDTYFLY